MKEKIDIVDLLNARLGDNFKVGDKLLDIRMNATSIANMAQKQVDEDGEFAKVYAESIAEWLEQLANLANDAVALLISNQEKQTKERE
jgi:hypothetical protein